MPYLLVKGARLVCDHGGARTIEKPGQALVRIGGKPVLVKGDPKSDPMKGEKIGRCPNVGATIKPCIFTLPETKGDSDFIRIDRKKVCLDTVTGPTDGTPPGMVKYKVEDPGQDFVSEES
jgi:hypothetical protein